jgi:ribulose-5-phosphate 4-epimerase/fuculose-1-phosphate aldolase
MVVCDLDGNWVDGPPYSSQCSEVMIHSCIYKARPDVVSITHVHPDYTVLMTLFQNQLRPMAQEGVRVVTKPLPLVHQMAIISTEEQGQKVATALGDGDIVLLLGHGAVTVSTESVQGSVMAMAHLEHQARLNYLAMCAAGPQYPSIPMELALERRLGDPPHIAARVAQLPDGQRRFDEGGVWAYLREIANSTM